MNEDTVEMVAVRNHFYAGRDLREGETYFATPKDAAILEAEYLPQGPCSRRVAKKEYKTRQMKAETRA
jgi:hypothetical protein